MRTVETLIKEAAALANGMPSLSALETETARQLQICNACRYCESYCAVFPAMTRRLDFGKADIHFLANLCHNCGACLHACQYAPPHEFAVNVPKAMAQVRVQTYTEFAWPAALGVAYQRNGLTLSIALASALALFMVLVLAKNGTLWGSAGAGAGAGANFYTLFPHTVLVAVFAPVFLFATLAMAVGLGRFWRALKPVTSGEVLTAPAAREATAQVLTLKYLDGGHGLGCPNADDAFTLARRRAHHLTFYGFMLCFAATCVATLYHYLLGWPAPYALPSVPKVLGVIGGVSLLVGSAGLLKLNLQRDPAQGDAAQRPMDLGFTALLFLISLTGLALWLAAATDAMPALLAVHLGTVMALFLTMPYGKFAHGLYRTIALLRNAVEKRQPNRLSLGSD